MRTAASTARKALTGAAHDRPAAADGPVKPGRAVVVVPDEAAFTAAGPAIVWLI
jgi:hypothetical protein